MTKDGEQCISPWDAEHAPNPVIFPWLKKGNLTPANVNFESRQSLQPMTRTNSSTPGTSSPSEVATHISANEESFSYQRECTYSSGSSETSCEFDAGPEGRERSVQPREADALASKSSDKKPSSYYCDVCQTKFATQGKLKYVDLGILDANPRTNGAAACTSTASIADAIIASIAPQRLHSRPI